MHVIFRTNKIVIIFEGGSSVLRTPNLLLFVGFMGHVRDVSGILPLVLLICHDLSSPHST